MTRQLCDVSLDGAPARQVAVGPAAEAAVDAGLMAGAAIVAAEELGLAQHCLDMTVAYLKERHQFARQIGSFQALKHRLADLWTMITQARAASRYAAACLADDDPDAPVAVALAKAACGEAAVAAAQECVQMHGGIGFTWEHPAHLYLKRAKASSVLYGTPGAHRAALADLVNLPGPGALSRLGARLRSPRRRPVGSPFPRERYRRLGSAGPGSARLAPPLWGPAPPALVESVPARPQAQVLPRAGLTAVVPPRGR
jgi:hypothetical protein